MAFSKDELTRELLPTRATLIHRLKNWQDQASWQEFFDIYWKLIYAVSRQGGLTEAESQDVVQETMISVAKHMPTFQYDSTLGSFKAWLLNMTRWRMADQLRKRNRLTSPTPTDGEGMVDVLSTIPDATSLHLDKIWDAEWENNLMDAALMKVKRRLDPKKYQVFDFYVNKEWPAPKVADAFSIPIEQVYLAKHRVVEMIKEEVERLRTAVI